MSSEIHKLLQDIFESQDLQYAVLSSPKHKEEGISKVTIRPIMLKKEMKYQVSTFRGTQAFHANVSAKECQKILEDSLQQFKQALLHTTKHSFQILTGNKRTTILKKPPRISQETIDHNRKKQYVLNEGNPIPFLIELGVMSREGKVLAKKMDKFRQLNRFLEMISDVLPYLKKRKLHIVDFGCGKSYLTFALYHYLVNVQGLEVAIIGLDLKEEVIAHCQQLARSLVYKGLQFAVGDINHYVPKHNIDMVISLHACDTATDAAIEKAIQWNADVILSVPCCQHELYDQVSNAQMLPILQHGILKERFAALATDAVRAKILEIVGYHTQVLEFIDLEHTPKNLLIRAIKKSTKPNVSKALEEYKAFKEALQISPTLERVLEGVKHF